jgi:hypothetical protein
MVKLIVVAVLVAVATAGPGNGAAALHKPAPRPEHGKTFVVTPTKGHVIVYRRGNRKVVGEPVALQVGEPVAVPAGTVVDTSGGAALIASAADSSGSKIERGTFSRGPFSIRQAGTNTAISLGGNGARVCSRPRTLASRVKAGRRFVVLVGAKATRPAPSADPDAVAAWVSKDQCTREEIDRSTGELQIARLGSRRASPRRATRLFSRGRFRTRGRYSSASVRGRFGP